MNIDLNQPFTAADVAELLGSKDDSRNRQLRVTTAGIAYISDIVENIGIEGLCFRLETWQFGNGCTGAKAANNPKFVARIDQVLRKNWPNPSSSFIDVF